MPRAAPADHERLDPVRWQRPTRGTMLRLVSVAVLLVTAAAVLWLRPVTCAAPSATPEGSASRSARPSASLPGASTGTARGSTGSAQGSGADPATETIPPGNVGVPIRLADPTALAVVRPGNRVDLLRLDPDRDRTTPVANAALVLKVTGADDPVTGGLLLALTPDEAGRALAASSKGFAIVIRPG